MTTATATGLQLSQAILGAGTLLVPPVVLGVAGTQSPLAWTIPLAGGATLSLTFGLLAHDAAIPGSLSQVVAATLGDGAGRTVLVAYLGGFIAGQAAIAKAAGGFAAAAAGQPAAPPATLALLILAVATAAVAGGCRIGSKSRSWRSAGTVLLALIACSSPGLLRAAGLLPGRHARNLAGGILLVFFAGVGWEASARLTAPLGSRRRVVAAVTLAAAVVAAVYLALAVVLAAHVRAATAGVSTTTAHPALRAAAIIAAASLASYCVTGLAAASAMLRTLGGPPPPWCAVAVGGASAAVVVLVSAAGGGITTMLIIPCLAAWLGCLLASAAMVRRGSKGTRFGGALLLTGLLVLLPWAATTVV